MERKTTKIINAVESKISQRKLHFDPIINTLFLQTYIILATAEISTNLATMLDGIIISRCIDQYAVAANGLASPYSKMLQMVGGFFAMGTQVVYSKYAARNDLKKGNEAFSTAVKVITLVGFSIAFLLFVFSKDIALFLGASSDPEHLLEYTSTYLKGLAIGFPFSLFVAFLTPLMNIDGDKKRITLSVNTMLIVKVGGDLLIAFCLGADMFKLALTTSIGAFASFVVLALHFKGNSSIKYAPKFFNFNYVKEISGPGLTRAAERGFSLFRSYALNIICITLAGSAAVAANTIVHSNIKIVPVCFGFGIGLAVMSLTGFLYGERDRNGLYQVFASTITRCLPFYTLINALIFIFAPYIVKIFGADEIEYMTIPALRLYAIGEPISVIKYFYNFYFQATDNRKMSLISSFLGEFLYLVVCSLVLSYLFGYIGFFAAYPVSEILYLITIYVIICAKNKHIPRTIDDFLFLGHDFDLNDGDYIDVTVSDEKEASVLSAAAVDFCKQHKLKDNKAFYIGLVVEEMATNVFKHGGLDEDKDFVDMKMYVDSGDMVIRLRDNCRPFNLKDRVSMLDDKQPEHNIGIRIVNGLAKDISYTNLFNLNQTVIRI